MKVGLCALALWAGVSAHAEQVTPGIFTKSAMVPCLTIQTTPGFTNQIRYSTELKEPRTNWLVLTNYLVVTETLIPRWVQKESWVVTESNYSVVDLGASSAQQRFYSFVQGAIPAPVLPAPTNYTIDESTLLTVTNTATLPDGAVANYSLKVVSTNAPTMVVTGWNITTNGVITWTPGEAQGPGVYIFTTVATNNASPDASATNSFQVIVNEVYRPPHLTVQAALSIDAQNTWNATATATDTDLPLPDLTFALVNSPTDMSITKSSPTTASISWTPRVAGSYPVTVCVYLANNQSFGATNSFTINVNPAPNPHPNMARIPAGEFQMGDANGDGDHDAPLHSVTLTKAFYMDAYLVTYAQWLDVSDWARAHGYQFELTSGRGKGMDHPVQRVTWYDVVKWCNARAEKEGLQPGYYTNASLSAAAVYRTGKINLNDDWVNWNASGYRLPTEAQWERAARGGTEGHRFPWTDADTIKESRANYAAVTRVLAPKYDIEPTATYNPTWDTGAKPFTSSVGAFAPNGYGLYDMAGNVEEWCWDWYQLSYYTTAAASIDPHGPLTKSRMISFRVLRGGSWSKSAVCARCSDRDYTVPASTQMYYGFRCVRNL